MKNAIKLIHPRVRQALDLIGKHLTEDKSIKLSQVGHAWACVRIQVWFTRTTDQGCSMRRAAIMGPMKREHEHEISAAVGRREERYRTLKEHDKEIAVPDFWKMTCVKRIMLFGEIPKAGEHSEKAFKNEFRAIVME